MMGISGCTVTWWPVVSVQALPRPGGRPRAVSQEDQSYPQRVVVLSSKP